MSSVNAAREFEYWDYVHCAICFMPFVVDPTAPGAIPTTPFWLTECGHTICNGHLKSDQSCPACGAGTIQLIPLQKDIPAPMSDWFRSIPHALDGMAGAAKFQQEAMASLIRFYKRKCSQYRATAKRVNEVESRNKQLQSKVDQLEKELEQLRNRVGPPNSSWNERPQYQNSEERYNPGNFQNANGKRPMTTSRGEQSTHRQVTPRPPRLTLPPEHQPPPFPTETTAVVQGATHERPGTGRFEQYAYQTSDTPMRPLPVRHQQQTHIPRSEEQISGYSNHDATQTVSTRQSNQAQMRQMRMPPPPTPILPYVSGDPRRRSTGQGQFRPMHSTRELQYTWYL
ncbi:hypothetical protein M422DRAFT_48726 [Sphaerobolus stellatus SS14]|uniref:RING-type domain-containing protein n=1 Tax=Sphaerobolus stellatus (strain SS14) TaxID=990650 RepID=A0A0C9VS58_SPHS4|nr:hypothetical protein M422DRAFT_48726 [Sphaerobolus stellatus SS14]